MKTCLRCADASCANIGTNQLACDDWTSATEDEPLVEQPDALAVLQARVDALQEQFGRLQRAASEFIKTLQEG